MKYQHFHFCVLQIFMIFQCFRLFVILRFSLSRSFVLGDSSAPILDPLGFHVAPIVGGPLWAGHFGPLGPFGLAWWPPPWATTWCLWVPLVRFWALRFPIWATFEAFKSQLGHVVAQYIAC